MQFSPFLSIFLIFCALSTFSLVDSCVQLNLGSCAHGCSCEGHPSALIHLTESNLHFHLLIHVFNSIRDLVPTGAAECEGHPSASIHLTESKDENGRENFWIFRFRFSYFFCQFYIIQKYSKQHENGIGCHGKQPEYGWAFISSIFVLGGKIR
jgi:hypothetical protein